MEHVKELKHASIYIFDQIGKQLIASHRAKDERESITTTTATAIALVGDHHVESAMREGGYNIGGESSGHIIFRDYATTGDGTLAALQVLAFLKETGIPASGLRELYTPWPLILKNIRLPEGADAKTVLENAAVQASIKAVDERLGASGRTLVRKSGTEPLIRVMVEAEDETQVKEGVETITAAIEALVGKNEPSSN